MMNDKWCQFELLALVGALGNPPTLKLRRVKVILCQTGKVGGCTFRSMCELEYNFVKMTEVAL